MHVMERNSMELQEAQLRNARTTRTGQTRPLKAHRYEQLLHAMDVDLDVPLARLGGKHAAPQGTSTKPQRSALFDWFERERERVVKGIAWTAPF